MILAKDLVESVMQRIGAAEYTILGTVKGAELELLRFTHPFMGFDVAKRSSAITSPWTQVPARYIPPLVTARMTT